MGFFSAIIPSVISAGASLLGGRSSADAAEDAAAMNSASQKEFAQHGIRWKVADAKAAGVHPLYALNAQTHSFAPSYVGGTQMGEGIAQAGQDISRAMQSTMDSTQRLQERLLLAQVKGQEIENAYKASLVSRLDHSAQMGPSMPNVEMNPSSFTASRPGMPFLEAAPPTPGQKEFAYETGGTWRLPSEQAKQAIEDVLPYEIEHYAMNRLLPGIRKWFTEAPYRYGNYYGRKLREYFR